MNMINVLLLGVLLIFGATFFVTWVLMIISGMVWAIYGIGAPAGYLAIYPLGAFITALGMGGVIKISRNND